MKPPTRFALLVTLVSVGLSGGSSVRAAPAQGSPPAPTAAQKPSKSPVLKEHARREAEQRAELKRRLAEFRAAPARVKLDSEGARRAKALEAALKPLQKRAIERLTFQLAQAVVRHSRGEADAFGPALQKAMQPNVKVLETRDALALSAHVTRAMAGETVASLETAAAQLQSSLDQKKMLREEIAMLRDCVANWPAGGGAQTITYRDVDGTQRTESLTKQQVEALIQRLEAALAALADQSEQGMLQLQQAMEKQSRYLQTISNLSKKIHDTLQSIIQNLK